MSKEEEFWRCLNNGEYGLAYGMLVFGDVECSGDLWEEVRMRIEGVYCVTDRTFKRILIKDERR